MLADRQKVGEDLGGVELVGEPVVDRDARHSGELLDDLWPKPRYSMASYIRPRTRAVSFTDSFLPMCEPRRAEVGDVRALVVAATSKAQRVRVESFSKMRAMFFPRRCCCSERAHLARLQVARQVEEVEQLLGREVVDREEVPAS